MIRGKGKRVGDFVGKMEREEKKGAKRRINSIDRNRR